MLKICFVCYGNTCRSPMAEFIFKYLVKQNKLKDKFIISSAGTSAFDKKFISKESQEQLNIHNIDYDKHHLSSLFTSSTYENNDYIIVMDNYNLKNVKMIANLSYKDKGKISKLLDYVINLNNFPNVKNRNVADPYGTDKYAETYNQIYQGCKDLLKFLINKYHFNE